MVKAGCGQPGASWVLSLSLFLCQGCPLALTSGYAEMEKVLITSLSCFSMTGSPRHLAQRRKESGEEELGLWSGGGRRALISGDLVISLPVRSCCVSSLPSAQCDLISERCPP